MNDRKRPALVPRIQPVPDNESALRQQRVANYRVKLAAGFRCSFPRCQEAHGILVCVDEDGQMSARCERHREGLDVTPGQFSHDRPPEAA